MDKLMEADDDFYEALSDHGEDEDNEAQMMETNPLNH
jgi:hypothetical protein